MSTPKRNSITLGDCVAGMKELEANSVDLAFADPPFNIGYEYDAYDDRKECDQYLAWSREWIAGVHRVLKPTGTFWLAIGDEFAAELKLIAQQTGFHCRSWVIWYYTFGVNCSQKFSRSHVHLFHLVRDRRRFTFNFQDRAIRIPSARQTVYADSRANPDGRLPDDTWILRPQDYPEGFREIDDTWFFSRVAGTFKERAGFHGCQMPERLLGRIIRASSNETDPPELVLDPFSGSGTTLAVAKKLKRDFLGFDLSPEYVKQGTARLASITPGDALEGPPEPLLSAPPTPGVRTPAPIPIDKSETMAKAQRATSAERSSGVVSAKPNGRRDGPRIQDTGFSDAVRAAFKKSSQGFSADRLIADPDLNAGFHDQCRKLGIEGSVAEWNQALFRLRKAGRLSNIPTVHQTAFSWDDADAYLFASEIALAAIENQGVSLDRALCDPVWANKFDEIAQRFAPGHSVFEYRWTALKIRKGFSTACERASEIRTMPLQNFLVIGARPHERFAGRSALYVVSADSRRARRTLYVGETQDFAARLSLMASQTESGNEWRKFAKKLHVSFKLVEYGRRERMARAAWLIARRTPQLNYQHSSAVREQIA